MRTADKFEQRISTERKFASKFRHTSYVVPSKLVFDILKRVRQLEDEFKRDYGYIPGKPSGKEHISFKKIFGIESKPNNSPLHKTASSL